MHHKKLFVKNNSKTNGPLTWDSLNEDLIEGFNTEKNTNHNSNHKFIRLEYTPNSRTNNFIEKKNTNNENYNENTDNESQIISENQQSPTFRTVGPHQDSTINNQGQKYSDMVDNSAKTRTSPGYYGRSRLTRI